MEQIRNGLSSLQKNATDYEINFIFSSRCHIQF